MAFESTTNLHRFHTIFSCTQLGESATINLNQRRHRETSDIGHAGHGSALSMVNPHRKDRGLAMIVWGH